jgi:transcriptional antiterminator RfaH
MLSVSEREPRDIATGGARYWYVVYSKPRQETSAEFHLQQRGVEVFAPKLSLPKYVARPSRVVPLFPSYLFVRIDPAQDYCRVLWAPGVKRFVSSNGVPTPLEDAVVTFLVERADSQGTVQARADLQVGQMVEIARGPFDGLIGIIQKPPDAKGRIKVLMQLLNQRPVKVDVPVQFVRTHWVV